MQGTENMNTISIENAVRLSQTQLNGVRHFQVPKAWALRTMDKVKVE